ncbi:MAG: hypothetical protein IT198_01155 [Acidimicrobiia bacterium]|nr:hypothetical protein [Acidimicrobiia bacterium]
MNDAHTHGHPVMHCEEVLIVLQTWIDEQLEEAVSGQVTSHIERCTHCDSEAKSYIRLKAALRRQRSVCDEVVVERLQIFGRRLCDGSLPDRHPEPPC